MADPSTAPEKILLHCLDGGEAPPEIAAHLRRMEHFPAKAKERLWEILGPSLADPLPPGIEELVERFCSDHGVSSTDLALVVKAARFLLREASSRDLGRLPFIEDLALVSDRHLEISRVLMAGFDAAKAQIRQEMVAATLAEHGKLVEGVDYRAEIIASSSKAKRLKIPVALLTLRYREGEVRDRITLHLSPDMVRELRNMCDKILLRQRERRRLYIAEQGA